MHCLVILPSFTARAGSPVQCLLGLTSGGTAPLRQQRSPRAAPCVGMSTHSSTFDTAKGSTCSSSPEPGGQSAPARFDPDWRAARNTPNGAGPSRWLGSRACSAAGLVARLTGPCTALRVGIAVCLAREGGRLVVVGAFALRRVPVGDVVIQPGVVRAVCRAHIRAGRMRSEEERDEHPWEALLLLNHPHTQGNAQPTAASREGEAVPPYRTPAGTSVFCVRTDVGVLKMKSGMPAQKITRSQKRLRKTGLPGSTEQLQAANTRRDSVPSVPSAAKVVECSQFRRGLRGPCSFGSTTPSLPPLLAVPPTTALSGRWSSYC